VTEDALSSELLLPLLAGAGGAVTRCGVRRCGLGEVRRHGLGERWPASAWSTCSILLHVVYAFRSFVLVSRWRRLGVRVEEGGRRKEVVALGDAGRRHKTRQGAASSCLVPHPCSYHYHLRRELVRKHTRKPLACLAMRFTFYVACHPTQHATTPFVLTPPTRSLRAATSPTSAASTVRKAARGGRQRSKARASRSLPAAALPLPCCFVLLALSRARVVRGDLAVATETLWGLLQSVCVCVCVHEKRWEDLKRKGGRILSVAVAVEVTYVDDWIL
jgi:hypothetical protein